MFLALSDTFSLDRSNSPSLAGARRNRLCLAWEAEGLEEGEAGASLAG